MNIFKTSYKTVRHNDNTIYKGFGFKHLSDVTQYYVHPHNQSFNGTTTLCQPIGEALSLFSCLVSSIIRGDETVDGDFYSDDNNTVVFCRIVIPQDWKDNGVVERKIHTLEVSVQKEKSICVAYYNKHGNLIDWSVDNIPPSYKLLSCFCGLLAFECRTDGDFNSMLLDYCERPAADTFVNLHEDFYQAHKTQDYKITYSNLSRTDTKSLISFRDGYRIIAENRRQLAVVYPIELVPFTKESFNPIYHQLIPALPAELIIPDSVKSICNAVTNGDVKAVLLHGPAGTGKTVACKLVCQEIGLPIMDVVNCTENLDEFILGKFIPQDDKIVFSESYVTKAIREGGAVVFEEINFARPQYLAFLNSLLDDNGFVRLDNGEVVYRHPNFRFFATMNLGYFGTKELNHALYNRFNVVIEVAALANEAIRLMLITRIPECESVVEKLLSVYHKLKNKIDSEELDLVISPRNLENWARLAKYEGYIKAAESTILPVAKCDRALEDSIRGIIMLFNWS